MGYGLVSDALEIRLRSRFLWLSHRISNHKSPRLTHGRVRFYHLPVQRRKISEMGVFGHPVGVSSRYVR
jgi:hypothetical protein